MSKLQTKRELNLRESPTVRTVTVTDRSVRASRRAGEQLSLPAGSLPFRNEIAGAASSSGVESSHGLANSRSPANKPVVVMKFGGSSVGDVSSIRRVAGILQESVRENCAIAVVSAMSGITDQLIEFATKSAAGDERGARRLLGKMRKRHESAIQALISSRAARRSLKRKLAACLLEAERVCFSVGSELTPQAMDLISSMGERLCAPIVAAALMQRGIASEAIEATEVLVTDSHHGNADPDMELTRERCEARLRPLLEAGMIPVVTGFLGATADGAVTTLGRGGSDYSATIIGAALEAAKIIIWTDVEGVFTADPRLVPEASTIPEISYRQAATLAFFGAKVLHPKTLRPVLKRNAPVWIRSTFATDHPGTRITPEEHRNGGGAKALAAISEAALICVRSNANGLTPERIKTARTALGRNRAEVLFHSQTSADGEFCLVVHPADAKDAVAVLRRAFLSDQRIPRDVPIALKRGISVLTIVGDAGTESSRLATTVAEVMRCENVRAIASAQDDSNYSFSFALDRADMKRALVALHRELRLEIFNSRSMAGKKVAERPSLPSGISCQPLAVNESGN